MSQRRRTPSSPAAHKAGRLALSLDRDQAPPRLLPEANGVVVRMYRQGTGDCFLLAFATEDRDRPSYVLIDCGVHPAQPDGTKRMEQVLQDIAASTGGRLDVVVQTHAHTDHLSGFVQAGSPFVRGEIEVGEVWFGWTEQRGEPEANRLRTRRQNARQCVDQVAGLLRHSAAPGDRAFARQLGRLLEGEAFPRDDFDSQAVKAVRDAIRRLISAVPYTVSAQADFPPTAGDFPVPDAEEESVSELALCLLYWIGPSRYCEAGEVLEVPRVPHARAVILGPPRNAPRSAWGETDAIGTDPSSVYLSGHVDHSAFATSPILRQDLAAPHAEAHPIPFSEVAPCRFDPAHTEKCVAATGAAREIRDGLYRDAAEGWRQIDTQWLRTAEQVAINVDADANNASLALAFELGATGQGRVLLFPGDAQIASWLSWRDRTYTAGTVTLAVDDLLRRTVLYKVGQHGGRNGTAKCDPRNPSSAHPLGAPYGLELMKNIVAMLTVDRAPLADAMPKTREFPHEPLYERLREVARRRVLRSDQSIEPLDASTQPPDRVPQTAEWERVPELSGVTWRRSEGEFVAGAPGPLYYDVLVTSAR